METKQTLTYQPNFQSWVLAARPKTLLAALVPIMVGTAVANSFAKVNWMISLCAFACTVLIQIATNYINDAADFEKGADTNERLGPARAAALGLLTPKALYIAAYGLLGIALLLGSYLIFLGGIPFLVIGLCSLLFAVLYTSGPYPLAYNGLGDLFVFMFFGLVAVNGLVYLQIGYINQSSIVSSSIVGLLATGLIILNNTRDIETDIKANKRTLSVLFGEKYSKHYYASVIGLSYLLSIMLLVAELKVAALLALFSLPFAVYIVVSIYLTKDKSNYNNLLAKNALLMLIYGTLFFIGSFF